MGSTDIQICMEASNWMQGPISHELAGGTGLDSPTSVDDAMFGCGQQLIERRLRPPQDQSLKCPRCDSTHTKFCYYNNYSLSQPRYFCKTCRRYWTKGGTLRNIPVGGGCRKNTKKSSSSAASKKPSADLHCSSSSTSPLLLTPQHNSNNNNSNNFPSPFPLSILGHEQPHTAADLHLAFPEQIHFSSLSLNHAAEMFASNPPPTATPGPGFMLDNPARFDFMGRKNEAIAAAGDVYSAENFHHGCGPPYNTGTFSSLDHQQRMMMMMPVVPYEEGNGVFDDVKPNGKMENQLPQPHSFGYNFGGLGSWTGFMNGYGASTTNPLV